MSDEAFIDTEEKQEKKPKKKSAAETAEQSVEFLPPPPAASESISVAASGEASSEAEGFESEFPSPYSEVAPPSIASILRGVISGLDGGIEAANAKHAGDGLSGVNLHGTRLMNNWRSCKSTVLTFADFLDKEGIE